jgi:hypothetical protein
MLIRKLKVIGAFISVVCWGSPGQAQDSAAAEALFHSAREAAEMGDWVTACDRFEESKRLEPAPGTVLNLARCREQLGQIASAWKSYMEAAQRLPDADSRQEFARRKARELKPLVPEITFHPPKSDVDVVVIVRNTELSSATFGVPLPFDPGEVEITVRAKGYVDNVTKVTLAEGEHTEHQLELGATETSRPAPSAKSGRDDKKSPGESTGAAPYFVLGGVGMAAAVGGAIWTAIELPTVKDEENCIDKRCNDKGADAAARGRIAVGVLAVGSVMAGTGFGVGTYLVSKKRRQQVTFVPLPGGGALSWKVDL